MTCGVYKLQSPSGKFYIGSSIHAEKRTREHRRLGRFGVHYNETLNAAFRKYGDLDGSIIVVCRPEDRIMYEQLCIDGFKPQYNRSATAGVTAHTAESREKIAASKRGKPRSVKTRERVRAANLGKRLSEETKAKIAASSRALVRTPEHNAKIGAAHKGMKRSPETCAKISAKKMGKASPLKGSKRPAEFGAKISAAKTGRGLGRKHSAETLAKMSASRAMIWQSEEYRAKVSAAVTGLKRSPEATANIAAANRLKAQARIAA